MLQLLFYVQYETFCKPFASFKVFFTETQLYCHIKVLHLQCLSHTESPDGQRLGRHIHNKAYLYALVLTCQNFANSQLFVKDKATGTPHEVYYIQPSLASDDSVIRCHECFLYTYTGVGLSALLVSTCRAMREPLQRGTIAVVLTLFHPKYEVTLLPLQVVKQLVNMATLHRQRSRHTYIMQQYIITRNTG